MSNEPTGRARGGVARAKALSAEERRSIASEAAKARWAVPRGSLPTATHRGEIVIGETRIPCAVLDNGKRVLTEHGLTVALLGNRSGASKRLKKSGALTPIFLAPKSLEPFISDDLRSGPLTPIEYADGRRVVSGFDADILPSACDIWLAARSAGALQAQQLDKAQKAEMLMRGLAHVGIVALVDEATGYQDEREPDALQAILDAYLRKEFAAWAKRFPDEFYRHIFRLREWTWKGRGTNPPQVVARYTTDLVYERLAPGIVKELETKNPLVNGKRKAKHHQWLTEEVGHPALAQHLHAVIGLMRASSNWEQFKQMMDAAFPRRGDTLPLFIDGMDK